METLVNNIAQACINKTGGTFNTTTGEPTKIDSGYFIGGASVCYIIPHEFISGAKYLKSLLSKVLPKLDQTNLIGVWYNPEHNAVYIENSLHRENLVTALLKAEELKQIAIYDIANQKDIVV